MKKLISFLMILLLCLSLFACTKKQEEEEKPIENNNTETNNNTDTSKTDDKKEEDKKDDKVDTGFSGVYYSQTLQAEDPYFPYVIFTNDGKFTFVENVYEGLIESTGVYSINNTQIDCTLLENNLKGFAGENVKEMVFIKDGNNLILMNDLCMSQKLDVFSTEKRKPQEHSNQVDPYPNSEVVYVSTSDMAVPGYEPILSLIDETNFVFVENNFHGMSNIYGTYTMSDYGDITCYVDNADLEITEIFFKKVEDHYELQTDLILSRVGDKFYYYSGE